MTISRLALEHWAIPRARWDQARGQVGGLIGGPLTQMANRLRNTQPGATDTTLSITLNQGRLRTRRDEGATTCLHNLLATKVPAGLRQVRATGNQALVTLQRILGPQRTARANRTMRGSWQADPAQPRRLPVTLQLTSSWNEAVLGRRYAPAEPSSWTFRVQGNQIAFDPPAPWLAMINGEAATLRRDDWPQVARVYRACWCGW